jgi:hypothetical protein
MRGCGRSINLVARGSEDIPGLPPFVSIFDASEFLISFFDDPVALSAPSSLAVKTFLVQ